MSADNAKASPCAERRPLSGGRLRAALMKCTDLPVTVEVVQTVDSTNDRLLRRAGQAERRFVVCCAESQTCGRGRNGHHWLSPANGNLYLSVLTPYAPRNPAWLSLMSAAAVAHRLEQLGAPQIGVKWPNDLVYKRRLKLAGLLIESRFQRYVIGLGFNVHLPAEPSAPLQPKWTALDQILDRPHDRSVLAGQLSAALIHAFHQTDRSKAPQLMAAWRRYDVLRGCSFAVPDEHGRLCRGAFLGVDAEARLLHRDHHGRQRAFTKLDGLSARGLESR